LLFPGSVAVLGCGDGTTPSDRAAVHLLVAGSPLTQTGAAAHPANLPPVIMAQAEDGSPVAGAEIRFTATGGSTILPATVLTDASGVAAATTWTLPGPGQYQVHAAATGAADLVFQAEAQAPGFDLDVRFLGSPPADFTAVVTQVAQRLEGIVYGDLPDEQVSSTPACIIGGTPVATIDETIDDVILLVRLGIMDGPGGAGARGFPCLIRDPGTQTLVGFVEVDQDDWPLMSAGVRPDVLLHEMVHTLGLVPNLLNITTPSGFTRHCLELPSVGPPNKSVQDSHFSCAATVAAFDRIGGAGYTGNKVPLENGATRDLTGSTLNHHWRKTTFGNELMTGWFSVNGHAPLSLVTVAALEDLGYGVVYDAAESYRLVPPIATVRATPGLASDGAGFQLREAPAPLPVVHRSAGTSRR